MKQDRLSGGAALVIGAVITGWLTLTALWYISAPDSAGLSYQCDSKNPSGESLYEWIFRNRKVQELQKGPLPDEPDFLIIDDYPDPGISQEEVKEWINQVKQRAVSTNCLIMGGQSLSQQASSLYRREMEDFLQIRRTRWSVRYERAERENKRGPPVLQFVHEDGRSLLLESGLHFNGRPPRGYYKNQSADIYQWIPIYLPEEETETVSVADLHLTPDGTRLLQEQGIPATIPILFTNTTPLVRIGFNPIEIFPPTIRTGRYQAKGKLWFQSAIALYRADSEEKFYWRILLPWLNDHITAALERQALETPSPREYQEGFILEGGRFKRIQNKGNKEEVYIKGINLGAALPGKWSTQFPEDEHLYYRFFTQIKGVNFNTVRIYTLFPPSFYRTLKIFNEQHADDPLFLIQEIWPEEHPPENNYWGERYDESYRNEIKITIDALHGNSRIPPRVGRAWGPYQSDVSMWVMALLIGREMEPEEVLATNKLNPHKTFTGEYISAPSGPATEAWLASSCDYAVSYEKKAYSRSRPVGIVNWPTLDDATHPSEWRDPNLNGKPPFNDKAVVNINRFELEQDTYRGLFGAYHIYPNYPDFMNNQPSYSRYTDDEGVFRYGGYLQEFMRSHAKFPAIVAEYGISTSSATAHYNPDGYHHGGLTESEQAAGIIRMSRAIREEEYAGAILFEWIDEWAKKTWLTEPFMVPYHRQALWQNTLDPEQNYGIMAMEGSSQRDRRTFEQEEGGLSGAVWGTESYLYIELKTPLSWDPALKVFLGIDTYDRENGISTYPVPGSRNAPSGMEFLVEINMKSREAQVLAAESYNLSNGRFSSSKEEGQQFSPIRVLVNRSYRDETGRLIPPLYTDWGKLHWGPLDEPFYSVFSQGETLTVRIPWGLLNVSDPSGGTVLKDERIFYTLPSRDVFRTTQSEDLALFGMILRTDQEEPTYFPEGEDLSLLYTWPRWDVPSFRQREKKSIPLLKEFFRTF